jgi:hypothetical protein
MVIPSLKKGTAGKRCQFQRQDLNWNMVVIRQKRHIPNGNGYPLPSSQMLNLIENMFIVHKSYFKGAQRCPAKKRWRTKVPKTKPLDFKEDFCHHYVQQTSKTDHKKGMKRTKELEHPTYDNT